MTAAASSSSSSSPTMSSPGGQTAAVSAGSGGASGRLLIVANRLPVSMSIKQNDSGKSDINFASSAGGLVSALAGSGMESYWIGWPGGEVKSREDRAVVVEKLKALKSIPVFLNAEVCDLFYNGFCNDLLWPLFHYIPLPISAIKQHDKQFAAYQKANAEFAKVVLDEYNDGDVVWVHDYHLMLLPTLLRQARPGMKIGFFFHTPFPSSEIYRVIPSRDELLYGVLSANLLGFHTHDYSRHFQSAATRIIGALCSNEQITLNGALSQLGTFPIGIDPTRFLDSLATPGVQKHMDDLRAQFGGKRVLLGIDRLDYIKGIPQKLHALELFFDRNPSFVGQVVLVQIAIPSRTDVEEYKKLKANMHELVGRINGRFGTVAAVPIHYLDQSIPFDKMCALYRVADCMVITSIRDGMNLVAYEYIACQNERNGVLILSEFAGAAQSLGAGALQVNPWNISEVADAIHKALTMDEKERKERTDYSFQHVMSHTARTWAKEFVDVLEAIPVEGDVGQQHTDGSASSSSLSSLTSGESNNQMKAQMPAALDTELLLSSFAHSKHKLIITGLAGIVSRAAALTLNTETAKGGKAATDIRSDYEEHAGELWGWQEPAGTTGAGATPTGSSTSAEAGSSDKASQVAESASAVGGHKALPILPPSTGPSRYQSHTQRSRTFAQLPSAGQSHSHSMEEWMEMGDQDGSAAGAEDDSGSKQPSLEELKAAIVALASDSHTTYLLLTSRSREWCDALFASVPNPPSNLWFAAENGYFFKHGHSRHSNATDGSEPVWHVMYENVDFSWMDGVHRVMTYFCERTPRSYIQVQETSMQWHYGDAERTFAKRQALDLISHLTGGPLSNTATEVLDSASIVQVRPLAVSKGRALKHLLAYLHKRYKRHSRQQQLGNRARQPSQHGSDSEEDPSTAATASLNAEDDSASHNNLSVSLNPAAIQSAIAESGVLSQRDGEQSGYEEDTSSADDEQDDKPAKGSKQARGSASLSGAPAFRPAVGIRSRRPSLADTADSGEAGSEGHSRNTSLGSPQSTLVLPSPSSSALSPVSSAAGIAGSSALSSQSFVPLDFVLCIGNFLERDEDIFPLLNEWADTGCLPPGLSSSNSSHTQHSQHSTPSMHGRRLSTQLPLSASQGLAAANHTASSASLASTLPSPQSTQSLNDMLSPGSSTADFGNSQPLTSLSVFTVTVGARPSKARYSLPDLTAVNSLIIQLAQQQQTAHSPTASPPTRAAQPSASYELKGMGDIQLLPSATPHQPGSTFDSEKEVNERQTAKGAGKTGQEQAAQ